MLRVAMGRHEDLLAVPGQHLLGRAGFKGEIPSVVEGLDFGCHFRADLADQGVYLATPCRINQDRRLEILSRAAATIGQRPASNLPRVALRTGRLEVRL